MIGAIAGDIAGSRFEFHNRKSKDFRLFNPDCRFTDDSVMTLAVAKAILAAKEEGKNLEEETVKYMRLYGRHYPGAGYGRTFYGWIHSSDPRPYGSFGNGAAMRVSACGWAAESPEEAKELAYRVTGVSHNHPESYKAAKAVATAIYMARKGSRMEEIRSFIRENYYPEERTLDAIRPGYFFDVSCQGSVPVAFEAFFESKDFEDTLRNAVSVGGDSDTIAAIAGSIAEAYYGVPANIRLAAVAYLDAPLVKTLLDFEARFGC